MNSFKKMLKEERKQCLLADKNGVQHLIREGALGEWAVKELKIWLKDGELIKHKDGFYLSIDVIYPWQIAVACFGEKEVRKRLAVIK